MQKYTIHVGIDVSKKVFDAAFYRHALVLEQQYKNTPAGVEQLLLDVRRLSEEHDGSALVCMEHTGLYTHHLKVGLYDTEVALSVMCAKVIQATFPQRQGKSDALDARRIGSFARDFEQRIRLYQPRQRTLQLVRHLIAQRKRAVKTKGLYHTPLKELKTYAANEVYEELSGLTRTVIEQTEQLIRALDRRIRQLILADEELHANYRLVCSVAGVGPCLGAALLLHTNNFTRRSNAAQLASYGGVAPFKDQSGSSRQRPDKVSKKSNRSLKELLHLGARSTIGRGRANQAYYERKVAEGKPKRAVINAIGNKMIRTVFAVIRSGTMYQRNHQPLIN